MKRICLILLVPFLFVPLFGGVTIDESVPSEYRGTVEKALNEATSGRKEADILLSSFSLEDDMVSLSLFVNGKERRAYFPLSLLESEIKNILMYEEDFFEAAPRLDYVTGASFSSLGEYWKKGTLLKAQDRDGKTRGVFVVSEKYDDVVQLEALYLKTPLPGLSLKRKAGVSLSSYFFIRPVSKGFGIQVDTSFYSPLYPFMPVFSIVYDKLSSSSFFRVGVGGKVEFNLSSLFPEVPVIKNIGINGSAALFLSIPSWSLSGGWSLTARYRVNGTLSFGAGYISDNIFSPRIAAEIGVLL